MTDASLLYVVLLGVYTGHQSGMVTMLLLLLLLFVESIHEMTHTRERFNFFCFCRHSHRMRKTEGDDTYSHRASWGRCVTFFFFPHTSGWISAIDRYMDTSMSYKHTHTHMQISMAIRALSNKVDIL